MRSGRFSSLFNWQTDGYRSLTPPQTQQRSFSPAAKRNVVKVLLVILVCSMFILVPSPLDITDVDSLLSSTPLKSSKTKQPTTAVTQATPATTSANATSDRPLITYVYSESKLSRDNFEFFIAHGLHDAADFVIIMNGKTNAEKLLPTKPNIQVVKRDNTCYDLGAHSQILTRDDLWKQYKRFILMNSSVRGPFVPHWAEACWSERFLNKVTDTVKLVGMTLNCWPTPHVQSMVWATDDVGMSLLLKPPPGSPSHFAFLDKMAHGSDWELPADWKPPTDIVPPDPGINACFANRDAAVEAEVGATGVIVGAGYKVDVMLSRYQSDPDFFDRCDGLGSWDVQGENAYDGINVHPFETLFIKTNRGISPLTIDLLTEWTNGAKFSSYDYC